MARLDAEAERKVKREELVALIATLPTDSQRNIAARTLRAATLLKSHVEHLRSGKAGHPALPAAGAMPPPGLYEAAAASPAGGSEPKQPDVSQAGELAAPRPTGRGALAKPKPAPAVPLHQCTKITHQHKEFTYEEVAEAYNFLISSPAKPFTWAEVGRRLGCKYGPKIRSASNHKHAFEYAAFGNPRPQRQAGKRKVKEEEEEEEDDEDEE